MTSLKGLVQAAHNGSDLIVTAPHYNWMERLEHEKRPNKAALLHAIKALLGGYKHERAGRFSPSAIGNPFVPCNRAVLFGYAGAPQLPPDIEAAEMMDHGSIDHIKWQMEGLTMGYMLEPEVWVYDDDLLTGGSMDGVLEDGSVMELKTANTFAYNRVVTRDNEVKYETLIQAGIYMLLSGRTWTSVVYEDRGGGQFHEFRIQMSADIEKEIRRRLRLLKAYMETDELPPMLDMCEQRVGSIYKMCGYRKICPLMKSVTQAQALASSKMPEYSPDLGRLIPEEEAIPTWAESILTYIGSLEEN
jgi:hypothetical protein